MIRIYVVCEGQTEATFVQELLKPHFCSRNMFVTPTLIGKSSHKGGDVRFLRLLNSLKPLLLAGHKPYCTTMIDYYGLAQEFPGKLEAEGKSTVLDKATVIKSDLVQRLESEVGAYPLKRFIPYVQMYEFEGLLFSHPASFAKGIDKPLLESRLNQIRIRFDTPEDINDHPQTAPSKRITGMFPEYDKPTMGTLAALEIGLLRIRKECPLFDAWLKKLENLPALSA